ncbi:uncharacterized protein TNCV_4403771 [Trichonephila clavipes]|uniref:Uncharacterized protein n=1 Tax=Trichonephila clavipes TaxID=2585209 RepID=A0A8X6S6T4_TRICX|nr:uncharacterized protein TNCV_4403771 [Trichonephila clavipes]
MPVDNTEVRFLGWAALTSSFGLDPELSSVEDKTRGGIYPPNFHIIQETLLSQVMNNMLTKYQRIKFIDFCEVWFLPESVARVAAIVGDHRCHTPRHQFKETLDVFLGYSRPSSSHTLPKLIW